MAAGFAASLPVLVNDVFNITQYYFLVIVRGSESEDREKCSFEDDPIGGLYSCWPATSYILESFAVVVYYPIVRNRLVMDCDNEAVQRFVTAAKINNVTQ